MKLQYVQFGCGLSAPIQWLNYDVSPTLRLQKLPALGIIIPLVQQTQFPKNVRYGDITKGTLGLQHDSCTGVFCSHVLEHLPLEDLYKAIRNTYLLLEEKGRFRLVLPDFERLARAYIEGLDNQDPQASIKFIRHTMMGTEKREKNIKTLFTQTWGNSKHLWMWDQYSLTHALYKVGFSTVRKCSFNDAQDEMFKLVEDESRFKGCLALEAIK